MSLNNTNNIHCSVQVFYSIAKQDWVKSCSGNPHHLSTSNLSFSRREKLGKALIWLVTKPWCENRPSEQSTTVCKVGLLDNFLINYCPSVCRQRLVPAHPNSRDYTFSLQMKRSLSMFTFEPCFVSLKCFLVKRATPGWIYCPLLSDVSRKLFSKKLPNSSSRFNK